LKNSGVGTIYIQVLVLNFLTMGLEDDNENAHGSARPFSSSSSSNDNGHHAGSKIFVCFQSRTHMNLLPKPILRLGRSDNPANRLRRGANRGKLSPMIAK